MNYLAHAYFSFNDDEIMVGNMISDFVKGRRKFDYPERVQQGISLHRQIDQYTDEHPATREAKEFFRPAVGLYAGAFVDVVYDHFLAMEEHHWSDQPLDSFAADVYETLYGNFNMLPGKMQGMLPYMKSQNWLYNYQFHWGIEQSFEGVVRRAVYLNNSAGAFAAFNAHYDALRQISSAFIADVKKFAAEGYGQLIKP